MRDSLTRVDLERMVLEFYHEMERKRGGEEEQGESVHALIATDADRGVTGGDDGQGRRAEPKEKKGDGGSGQQQQP